MGCPRLLAQEWFSPWNGLEEPGKSRGRAGGPVEKANQRKEGWQQLKEEPPERRRNTSIQATASGGRPAEEAIQRRKGRQQLEERPPYSQGKESMHATASGGRPVDEAIQSKEGWQQLKEEPPD